ncbi:MAG: Do family serine endopeptidase [Methylotenera sp.]|nr:Do family serine endopeptidase [Methylotenera sp.]MDP1754114.1 Do family serine endopeptidase [Methylotenera sp.]MDP1959406.1 Do family serine endopeptidase [Methylotenera sp.]MDP3206616.1 Do family serine endopeptidase [Methylotenera sp.]MDP3302790.1 Do family serine endopeptidase [Methylotenera sp.]
MNNQLHKKIWLIFAQTATVCMAILFVLRIFYPDFLSQREPPRSAALVDPAASVVTLGSYSYAAKKAMPAVVNIFTSKKAELNPHQKYLDDPAFRQFFGDQFDDMEPPSQPENSLGSGVIVSDQGLILTNNHVIATADEIEIALSDGRKMSAKVVGTDPDTDLALIKVDADHLPAITFASSDKLNVGDVVLAIGNPFGVGQTVTQGIVSALGRSHLGINIYENFIQTDASINPGNSGGALIDADGNLVGINSAIYSRSGGSMGIGFAIPASLARQVMEQIVAQGNVTRGWIGIEAQDITPALADSFRLSKAQGALVAGVLRGSPAERAGLRAGDILLAIEGKPVIDSGSMLNLIAALKPNQKATVQIARAGEIISVSILIGKRPKPAVASD